VVLLGRWNWWPSRMSRPDALPAGPAPGGATGERDLDVKRAEAR
jgi:hypothetical protein